MIFLGLASNLSARQIIGQLFAWGTKRDSQKLKAALSQRYQSKERNIRLYHTGRSALAAGFRAVGSSSGKVIVPGLTCIAVIRAVRAAGFEPVYADIDPQTLQYDWEKLEDLLANSSQNAEKSISGIDNSRNLCYNGSIIVAQNTLGLPLEMQRLEKIAQKYGLRIVEDLAHCAGRFYADGREVGTVGAATALSFGKGKAIDTSEGGALVLRGNWGAYHPPEPEKRPKLADTLRDRWYPIFGTMIRGGYYVGLGKVMTAVLVKLRWIALSADAELDEGVRLTHWQAKIARKQLEKLPQTPLREFALVEKRNELLKKLEKSGARLCEIWYDTPVAPARYEKEADFPKERCPNTVRVAESIVNLPTWYQEKKLETARKLIAEYAWHTDAEVPIRQANVPRRQSDALGSRDDTKFTEWREIQAKYPEANFLQSPSWGRVNELIGHKVVIEEDGASWCLMIVKNAKRGRYLEVPGGPLVDWENSDEVDQAFAKIRAVAEREKCVFVRLRPQLRMSEENLRVLERQGCQKASMHLHAEHTVIVDLEKSEEELLADMRRQTRYEVRKADKLGIEVEWGTGEELFREFHRVQLETAARQHFVPPDLKMLLAEREGFGDEASRGGAQAEKFSDDNSGIRIYTAKTADGQVICYGLIIIDGAEAEYFEAASTELGREFPGTYALLWRVMRDLKAMGVKRFNLWGIAPEGQPHHRYAGVTTFKKGFGGEVVEFVPAQDIVLKKSRYLVNVAVETARKKKRHL